MKYFTPELLERFGSSDDEIADAAQEEWEEAGRKYAEYLRKIKKYFPRRLKALLQKFYLHDAKLCFIGTESQTLHLSLQLDPPPRPTVFLRYGLAEEIQRVQHAPPSGDHGSDLYWLYDEFELISDGPFPLLQHSILLSSGLELQLIFQTFQFTAAQGLTLTDSSGNPPRQLVSSP